MTIPRSTPHASPRRTLRAAGLLAGLVALLVALPGAFLAGASAATSDPTGWIRVGHLSPETPKAEVRLTPFSGGETRTLTDEADFGDLSEYQRVPVGLYTVSLVDATTPDADAMLSRNVEITEGGAATVVATGEAGQARATVLRDDLSAPPEGQAKVRLLSASTQADQLEASVVDGPVLAQDLGTGSSTGYADVDAQTWDIELSAANGGPSTSSRVPVEAGGVYTLVALDTPEGDLELRAVMDSSSSRSAETGMMPSGGVDTGAGGLAAEQGGAGAGALAAFAALTAATVALLRRRAAA